MVEDPLDIHHPIPAAHRERNFAIMVSFSLVIHCAATFILLSGGPRHSVPVPASFVDLQMLREETSPTPPVDEAMPEKTAATEDVPPPAEQLPESAALQQRMVDARHTAETQPAALSDVSFGFGMMNGYFDSLGEGKSLRPEIREYYLDLLQRLNECWWKATGETSGPGGGVVLNVMIARDGTLQDLQLIRGSGNQTRDRAIVEAIRAASPLPRLPDSFTDSFFQAPLRFVPPLNLMGGILAGRDR